MRVRHIGVFYLQLDMYSNVSVRPHNEDPRYGTDEVKVKGLRNTRRAKQLVDRSTVDKNHVRSA